VIPTVQGPGKKTGKLGRRRRGLDAFAIPAVQGPSKKPGI